MKRKTPNIVIIATLTLVTVLVWFGSEIFRNFSKKPDIKIPDEILSPLDPTLDETTLGKLENSLFFDASPVLPSASPTASPTVEPTVSPTPTASSSASATSSPSASPITSTTP